jgi:outer membrane lipoprotein-sorting protein
MKTSALKKSIILVITGFFCLNASSQNAAEILAKLDNVLFAPRDKQGVVTIILKDKTGKEKVKEATMIQKGKDKKLYRYTKPESQAGIATLALPGDVMWLYLPALGKPKKISRLAKDGSLLASEDGYYILNLISKVAGSEYTRIVAKIHNSLFYPLSMDYYDAKGKKIKEASYKYDKIGSYWNASEVLMTDIEKNHSTKILLKEMKFDQGLSDDLFIVERMNNPGAEIFSTTANNKVGAILICLLLKIC